MPILVAYASKHGATAGIAERVAERLLASGQDARALPVANVGNPAAYSAFVLGGAVYLGRWRKEAGDFVRQNTALLAACPVWLFCSGPLGSATTDDKGRDVLETSRPREFAEFEAMIAPRDLRVFYGSLDPQARDGASWLLRRLPAGRRLLPEGDFRNWGAIESWAEGIACELPAPTGAHAFVGGTGPWR
ncbi:MAG TPA: flavodoxin domain-containing protein [Dermatophilaceae bacterium]